MHGTFEQLSCVAYTVNLFFVLAACMVAAEI